MTRDGPLRAGAGWPTRSLGAVRQGCSSHPDLVALAIIVSVGAALRLAFAPVAPVLIHADSPAYYRAGEGLMTGDGFPLTLRRQPLYPAFIALVGRGLGEDLRFLAAVQHLLGLGSAVLTYAVGRLTFGRVAGLVGGLAAALSGGLLILERYVLTEPLFLFLLTLTITLGLLAIKRDHWYWHVAAGLTVGLTALTRPHAQILLLLIPLTAGAWHGRWRPVLRATALSTAAAAVLLVPWMTRNYAVHGSFAVGLGLGQHLILYLGGTPEAYVFLDPANPPVDPDPVRQEVRRRIQETNDFNLASPRDKRVGSYELHQDLMRKLRLGENEADLLMRDVAIEAIAARPLTFARHAFESLLQLFTEGSMSLRRQYESSEESLRGLNRLSPLVRAIFPQEQQDIAISDRLSSIYQAPRLGLLISLLYICGLLGSVVIPGWRLALLPGLAVLGLHLGTALTVGYRIRHHQVADPLTHVVAFGGVMALACLAVRLVSRSHSSLPHAVTNSVTAGGESLVSR